MADRTSAGSFPYKPELSSEALSASHLFTVAILSADTTPWAREADGLQHRQLSMRIRLLEVFKGTLDTLPNDTFAVRVEQLRESRYAVSGYGGIWSHVDPVAGQRYLVVSNAPNVTSPVALLREDALQQLLDASYASDVRFDLEAEQVYQDTLAEADTEDTELSAARRLLHLTFERRAMVRDVVARYVWDYVEPAFVRAPEQLLPDILALISAGDATLELRRSLIADLYDTVVLYDLGREVVDPLVKALLVLLLQPSASPLRHTLIEVQLYNLIVGDEQPSAAADTLVPDPAERERLRAAVRGAEADADTSEALVAWLA
ncbi:MAG: hypothetical protein JO023_04950 [Chloroflexi bacterium]|nr:hypothetical protein [Chloroflexota bacterium]